MGFTQYKNSTAAIIAGGQSKRFGSPKYRAQFAGKTLLDWSLQLAQTLSASVLVVSNDQRLAKEQRFPVYADVMPGKGPLGGILTALVKMSTEWLFVLPVDMPLLQAEVYQTLWENKSDQRPVVAVSENGVESMVSLWHQSNAQTIKRLLLAGQLKIHYALKTLQAIEVSFSTDSKLLFSNINFQEDLQRLEKFLQNRE